MILKVYAVYDCKTEAYFPPMYNTTNAAALRDFADKVNTPNHPWSRHPEDFSLFGIGVYDDLTAVITPTSPHVTLGKAIEYVNASK